VGLRLGWFLGLSFWLAGRRRRCVFVGLRLRDEFVIGFVRFLVFFGREQVAELHEAMEIFDGAAIEALGLGLEAQERGADVGLPIEYVEAERKPIGAVLGERDLDALGELGLIEDEGVGGAGHGLVEAIGKKAGLEGVHARHGVLGEGDAFDGGAFLGVDGLVGGDGAGDEAGDVG
jgi:hypothetical protein